MRSVGSEGGEGERAEGGGAGGPYTTQDHRSGCVAFEGRRGGDRPITAGVRCVFAAGGVRGAACGDKEEGAKGMENVRVGMEAGGLG